MALKIVSWNVNSIRKGIDEELADLCKLHNPDIICFQETKATSCDAEKYFENNELTGMYPYRYWNDSVRGQAGVSVWTKIEPLNVIQEIPRIFKLREGRVLILEFTNFTLLNTYVPNTGRGEIAEQERKVWHNGVVGWLGDKLNIKDNFLIWCGDLNVIREPALDTSHHIIRPSKPSAGLKEFEYQQFNEYLELGLIDVFRNIYPDTVSFTWHSPLNRKVGWRLDYFLVNDMSKVENIIHNQKLNSKVSDHTWIMLSLTNGTQ